MCEIQVCILGQCLVGCPVFIVPVSVDFLQFFRGEESRVTNSHMKSLNANNHDMSIKLNGSDCSHVESVESSFIKDLDSSLSLGEVQSRVR